MRRAAFSLAFLLASLLSAWAFLFTPPMSVTKVSAYVGPGDKVTGASMFFGLRGYSSAFSGKVANICDSATGLVCADATWSGGALTLPLIGGTACNNGAAICVVKTLYDQIAVLNGGTGNCASSAACDVTQATNSARPTLIVAGAANGCPSISLPCLAFVRANSQCLVGGATYTQAQPFSGELVGIRTGSTSSANRGINIANNWIAWAAITNTMQITSGTNRNVTANDSVWHAAQGIWSNSVGALSVDGTTTTANNGTSSPSSATILFGCSSGGGANSLDGKMAEVGIWPIAFTAGNISDLNTNAHSYWGF